MRTADDIFNEIKMTDGERAYNAALKAMLWDAYYLQALLADVVKDADNGERELILSDSGRRGLAMVVEHVQELLVTAIGICPSGGRKE